jgi:putative transcriptional regulator
VTSKGVRGLACWCLAASLALSAPTLASSPRATQLRRGAVKELAPGKLLVAARNLPDPNFSDSVVLLADFSAEGAMGLIVNRRTEVPLAKVLPGFDRARGAQATLFFGGPVSVPGVLALVRSATARDGSRRVLDDVYLVNTREALEQLVKEEIGAERFRVYAGYAGWGAGQLDKETAGGAWHVFDGDPEVVFDPDPESVWRRQIRRTEGLVAGRAIGDGRHTHERRSARIAAPPGSTDPP